MEQRDVVAGLRQMQVGLCHPIGAECRLISQQLERLGMTYKQVWPPVMNDLLDVDLVVLALVLVGAWRRSRAILVAAALLLWHYRRSMPDWGAKPLKTETRPT